MLLSGGTAAALVARTRFGRKKVEL